jgi:hypothetical protein
LLIDGALARAVRIQPERVERLSQEVHMEIAVRKVPSLALIPFALAAGTGVAAQDTTNMRRICLAPAAVETSASSDAAVNAVREAFTTYLTGPTLQAQALQARLASQVRLEARQAGCPFLLLTTVKHEKKRGSGLLGRVAAGAAQQGAWEAGVASGSTAGRIAGHAAYGAAGVAASNYAATFHAKDELTLSYRLESPDGKALAEGKDKRKAKADGEDMLTPLVEKAAEAVAEAVSR